VGGRRLLFVVGCLCLVLGDESDAYCPRINTEHGLTDLAADSLISTHKKSPGDASMPGLKSGVLCVQFDGWERVGRDFAQRKLLPRPSTLQNTI
jgi:hypothetical protein